MVLSLVQSINNSKSFYCGDRFGWITILEVSLYYFVASFFWYFTAIVYLCYIFKTSFCCSSVVLSLVLAINNSKSFYCED